MKTVLSLALTVIAVQVLAQEKPPSKVETILVPKGYLVILEDTTFITKSDTLITGRKIKVKEDPYVKSERFYDSLQQMAERSRVARELHEFLIRKQRQGPTVDSALIKSEDSFRKYEGLKIRSIQLKKVDLIEGTVLDTTLEASSKLGKLVNRIHADTRPYIIRNNLLFDVGDEVDPYKLADNERLLRQFRTIRDARIYLRPVEGTQEVDVVVVTQDVASVGASGTYSSFNNFSIDAYDINLLGHAKQLQVSYFRNNGGRPVNGYEIFLREPNFGHSFIRGELRYTDNYLRNRTSLSLSRDFLTPRMKYSGGLDLFRTHENYIINQNDTIPQPYTQENVDAWLARSIFLDTRTNFIVAFRTNDYRFTSRPLIKQDSNYFFFNRSYVLAGFTIFHTNYVKGSLIQGFGRTEDVPTNAWAGITLGNEVNDFTTRRYLDVHAGTGRYKKRLGYFYGDFTLGGFRTGQSWEDGILSFNGRYFSNLLPAGKTKVRQFINVSYVKGYNRTIYQSLGVGRGWKDQNGFIPLGSQRLTLGMETIYFTHWYYYGFKFALYHGADFHFLSGGEILGGRKLVFTGLKGGIRMLNDNLAFPTLSVDFNYYVKTDGFLPSFSASVSTTLPHLFGAPQNFKPIVASFQ